MSLPILEEIRIASPCSVPWQDMSGDDRVRHCSQCDLDVFNLAAMTRTEAEELVVAKAGRMCVQLYRRFDGTVVTQDCPVGWRKSRRAVRRRVMLSTIFVLALFGFGGAIAASKARQCEVDDGDAFDSPLVTQVLAIIKGQPTPVPIKGNAIRGRMVMPKVPKPVATP